jgi:uncharacterized protein YPO0396
MAPPALALASGLCHHLRMAKEKQSTAQRRQAGLDAAKSGRNLKRYQERSQLLADRAWKQVTEAQKNQADHKDFFSRTTGPLAKEATKFHVATIGFLNTEADVGLNFAHLAADSRDAKKMVRNRCNAREAYDSVLKRLDRAAPTEEELEVIQQKMATLRELLKSLGERM